MSSLNHPLDGYEPDKRLLKSFVWHNDQCFFVSTIKRTSSAAITSPPRYNETMAWEFDWDKDERGKWIVQTGCGGAIDQHYDVCEQLFQTGEYKER